MSDSISKFKPLISKSESNKPANYKIKLINFQNYEQNTAIRNYFEKSMKQLGLEVKKTNYTSDYVVYSIQSVNLDVLLETINENEAFEAIFSIEPMPKYTVALDMEDDEAAVITLLHLPV